MRRVCIISGPKNLNFNPRTPGGVRPNVDVNIIDTQIISIHAPRVGCDLIRVAANAKESIFQSTHPGWGAPILFYLLLTSLLNFNPRTPGGVRPHLRAVGTKSSLISIHAPRVGCDSLSFNVIDVDNDFNPRTPGGVRPVVLVCWLFSTISFQSTHPGRGATSHSFDCYFHFFYFNPRTPGGVRPNQTSLRCG